VNITPSPTVGRLTLRRASLDARDAPRARTLEGPMEINFAAPPRP
jgi:hypothetical protein